MLPVRVLSLTYTSLTLAKRLHPKSKVDFEPIMILMPTGFCYIAITFNVSLAGVKSEFLKSEGVFKIEWFGVQCNDPVEYQVQVCKRRDQDYATVSLPKNLRKHRLPAHIPICIYIISQIYRDAQKFMEVNPEELDKGVDYMCRVCAIRICDDRTQLIGPYSVPFTFHVPAFLTDDYMSAKHHSSNSAKSLSPTAQAGSTVFQVILTFLYNYL